MKQFFCNRTVAVVREITKLFEDVRRGTFEDLISFYEKNGPPKGEIVLVLSLPSAIEIAKEDIDTLLEKALKTNSVRDACALVAGTLGLSKKIVYQRALQLGEKP